MDLRKKELLDLRSFTQNIEAEVTMLLQSLQWDRKRLVEDTASSTCHYDENHRMPENKLAAHENSCFLRSLGYSDDDALLPDPPYNGAHTLVKLSNNKIQQIINEASKWDPQFKKGGVTHQPLSLSRLQLVYTADERRALHDAVVAAVPSCHDLGDLALTSSAEDGQKGSAVKSRVEILAELRNMKRRRTKYRVAAKTKNYSDVLRDVIKTQMESYTEAITGTSVKAEENSKYKQDSNTDYTKNMCRSNNANNKSMKRDNLTERDKSDDRRETSLVEKRYYDESHHERRHREGRRESSRRRHEDHRDRSNSRKRYESHRQTNHIDDDIHNERYKSGRLDRYEDHRSHRRHNDSYKVRIEEENGQRYANDRSNTLEKDKRKSHDYNESRHSERRYKEDKYRIEKIKVEPFEHGTNSMSNEQSSSKRSSSRDRYHEGRKRKHRDDDYSKHDGQNDDILYKRYYDVKKDAS